MSALTEAMQEYANAIRGDWSDFDGRTERNVIEGWISEIETPTDHDLAWFRLNLGICQTGGGHWCGRWYGHCTWGPNESDELYLRDHCNCPCSDPADA